MTTPRRFRGSSRNVYTEESPLAATVWSDAPVAERFARRTHQ